MPVRRPDIWWRRSRSAAVLASLGILLVAGLAAIVPGFGERFVLGLPILLFLSLVVLPFLLASIIVWFAGWQERNDRIHSVWEDE